MPLDDGDDEAFKSRSKSDTVVTTGNNEETDAEDRDEDYVPKKNQTTSQQLTNVRVLSRCKYSIFRQQLELSQVDPTVRMTLMSL